MVPQISGFAEAGMEFQVSWAFRISSHQELQSLALNQKPLTSSGLVLKPCQLLPNAPTWLVCTRKAVNFLRGLIARLSSDSSAVWVGQAVEHHPLHPLMAGLPVGLFPNANDQN